MPTINPTSISVNNQNLKSYIYQCRIKYSLKHKHKANRRTQKREKFSYPTSDLPEPIESNAKYRKVREFGLQTRRFPPLPTITSSNSK